MPQKHPSAKAADSAVPPAPGWLRRGAPWLPLVVVALGLAVYANGLSGPFVFDDPGAISGTSRVQSLWSWKSYRSTARPLLFFTFALNYRVGGFDPWGYKLANVLIHVSAALVLYGLVRRTLLVPRLGERFRDHAAWLALAVSALWVVHPLTTEAVTYIVHRGESLAALCTLLVLYGLLRGASSAWSPLWYLLSVAAVGFGMGVKETMITAPLLALIYDRIFLANSWKELGRRRGIVYLLMLLPVGWMVWHYRGMVVSHRSAPTAQAVSSDAGAADWDEPPSGADSPPQARRAPLTRWRYLRSQSEVILHYLRLVVWPRPLIVDYGWPVAESWGRIVPAGLAVIALLSATLWALWRFPPVGFLGAAFFVLLGPTSSIVPIPDLAAERRMYLPLAAVLTLLVLGAWWLLGKLLTGAAAARRPLVGGVLLAAAVCALSTLTILRNDDYASDLRLWESVVRHRPDFARARLNLSRALIQDESLDRQQRLAAALTQLTIAEKLEPNNAFVQSQIGHIMSLERRPLKALERFERAIALSPRFPLFHANRGTVLGELGDKEAALEEYRLAVKLGKQVDRDSAELHYTLAVALADAGRRKEALDEYREALRLNPGLLNAEANLGMMLAQDGNLREAIAHLRRAVELEGQRRPTPRVVAPYINLAVALDQAGEYAAAAAALDEAVALAQANGQPAQAEELRRLRARIGPKGHQPPSAGTGGTSTK